MMSCQGCYNLPLQPLQQESMTEELHRRSRNCISRCAQAYLWRVVYGEKYSMRHAGNTLGGGGGWLPWGLTSVGK